MKFSEYITSHHVFTTSGLMSACDSPDSATQQLWMAAKSGKVEKVRRGVYASFAGRFEGSVPDPSEIAFACDPDAVLCYHSALDALGVGHSVSFQCDFMSDRVRSSFEYRGVRYVPRMVDPEVATTAIRIGGGARIACTSKEQTIVDCLDRPWLAGGVEEVVRALTLFAFIDGHALLSILADKGAPSRARAGWLLEAMEDAWHVEPELLEELRSGLGAGPYRLGRPRSGASGWSSRWKLLLPADNEEVESWISRRRALSLQGS